MRQLILNPWVIGFSAFTASKRGFVLANESPKTGLVNSLVTCRAQGYISNKKRN
jgi:hypothetical protein